MRIFSRLERRDFVFLISVFVFIETNSELALGTFGLVNSAVSFFAYYFASRLIKKKARKNQSCWAALFCMARCF